MVKLQFELAERWLAACVAEAALVQAKVAAAKWVAGAEAFVELGRFGEKDKGLERPGVFVEQDMKEQAPEDEVAVAVACGSGVSLLVPVVGLFVEQDLKVQAPEYEVAVAELCGSGVSLLVPVVSLFVVQDVKEPAPWGRGCRCRGVRLGRLVVGACRWPVSGAGCEGAGPCGRGCR
jgi:hypothetical protein